MKPHCLHFVRSTLSICACTTAIHYLMRTPIARKGIRVQTRVIDLPTVTIDDYDPNELLSRWQAQGKWSNEVSERVKKVLSERKTNSEGAMHCEAGLLASLVRDEETTQQEPKPLQRAFGQLRTELKVRFLLF